MREGTHHEHIATDQTLFAAQEPYLDSGRSAFDTVDPHAPIPLYRQKKIIYAVGGVVGLVVMLVVVAFMMNGGTAPMTIMKPSPTPTPQRSGAYAQELKQIRDDLEKADPTQKELPFPPINPEISL